MNKTFFGFALSDSIFSGDFLSITRRALTVEKAKEKIKDAIPCLNPSHKATIDAIKEKFGIVTEIPETPPKITLEPGDSLIVVTVRGLPRLTDRHEFTREEINQATFTFAEIHVQTDEEFLENAAHACGFCDAETAREFSAHS